MHDSYLFTDNGSLQNKLKKAWGKDSPVKALKDLQENQLQKSLDTQQHATQHVKFLKEREDAEDQGSTGTGRKESSKSKNNRGWRRNNSRLPNKPIRSVRNRTASGSRMTDQQLKASPKLDSTM